MLKRQKSPTEKQNKSNKWFYNKMKNKRKKNFIETYLKLEVRKDNENAFKLKGPKNLSPNKVYRKNNRTFLEGKYNKTQ